LEIAWFTYRIVESGDLLEKLDMLLLGVTILGRGARLVTTARGTATYELRLLELLYPERREPETCSLSDELMYPDDESYDSEIPESEWDRIFFSVCFSRLFSEPELLSPARCVHSSPQPRDVDRLGISSNGVNGRSVDAWLLSDRLSETGFLLMPGLLSISVLSVSNGLSLSKDDARDTLLSKKSSPNELTRQVIFFVI
jgi:hypothetical protein